MSSEFVEEDVYIYLDFEGNIDEKIFNEEVFFRITNLDTSSPLVQLNNSLFKGQYENCAGTNMFFEELDHPRERSIFEKQSGVSLKYHVAQNKVISLKPVKIPSKPKDLPPPSKPIKVSKKYDYDTLLQKMVENSLNFKEMLEDVSAKQDEPAELLKVLDDAEKTLESIGMQKPVSLHGEPNYQSDSIDVDILKYKYEKLKNLARIPNKHKTDESILDHSEQFAKQYELDCLKSYVLRPSSAFPEELREYDEQTLSSRVDITSSIYNGVIEPSNEINRALTSTEKNNLLKIQNLENLRLPARYWVLKSQLDHIESQINCSTEEELTKKDVYGRTLLETADLYRELLTTLSLNIHGPMYETPSVRIKNIDSNDY